MENEIEKIITGKKYSELSAEEHEQIREYVSGEVEYNDIRSVLLSLENADNYIEKIKPRQNTKKALLAHYDSKYGRRSFSGLYKWLSVAAVLAVITAAGLLILKWNETDVKIVENHGTTVQDGEKHRMPLFEDKKNIQSTEAHDKEEIQRLRPLSSERQTDYRVPETTDKTTVIQGISMATNEDLMEITTVSF